ncbi:MAG: hypothetical protein AVDCRST_MAG18-269 [uncultured Thermomicrobiales bacterium]|uniref:Uncharacterized protein n=1 Tax=uncultured Thermomicrobiales bacterium TaxID=1645740 RepID=A0A6J4UKK8_9BACT|nr:MAG: hypothetical protein AVDCRST_MAG18-269 [uncultured Thermomicrobiales bacterium]
MGRIIALGGGSGGHRRGPSSQRGVPSCYTPHRIATHEEDRWSPPD